MARLVRIIWPYTANMVAALHRHYDGDDDCDNDQDDASIDDDDVDEEATK